MIESGGILRPRSIFPSDKKWRLLINTALLLLLVLLVVMLGISLYRSGSAARPSSLPSLRLGKSRVPLPIDLMPPSPYQFATHLVMVAGHAVLDNDRCGADLLTDDAWVLLDYQQNQGVAIFQAF